MNKRNLLSLVIALFIAAGLQARTAEQPGYRIEIKVKGFTENTMYLAYHMGNKQYMSDTVEASNGVAVFEGAKPLEGGIYLAVLPPENQYFEVIVADDQHFSLSTTKEDLIGSMKVKGSDENDVFYTSLQAINAQGAIADEIKKKMEGMDEGEEKEALQKDLQAAFDAMNVSREELMEKHPHLFYAKVLKAMKDPVVPEEPEDADENWKFYYYRTHFFDHVDFGDARMLRTPVLHAKIMRFMDKLSIQHYDSLKVSAEYVISLAEKDSNVFQYVAITLLNKYANSKVMCHDAVYVHIVDLVYNNEKAWWADEEQVKKIVDRANALRWTMCGNVAPQMVMKDTGGKQRSMHGIKAKYTLLYFWDYDCGHCKKVTPKVAELFPKYKDKGVALWTVSINGDEDIWKEKLHEYKLDNIGALNMQDHARKTGFDYFYDIRSTPRLFLLDENKKILAKQLATDQLEDLLNNLLEKELNDAEKEIKD